MPMDRFQKLLCMGLVHSTCRSTYAGFTGLRRTHAATLVFDPLHAGGCQTLHDQLDSGKADGVDSDDDRWGVCGATS